jgi:hypothetical protein
MRDFKKFLGKKEGAVGKHGPFLYLKSFVPIMKFC